jgi:hypothetical protein
MEIEEEWSLAHGMGISYDAPESKMVTIWLHFAKKWPSRQRRPKCNPLISGA